MPLAESVENMAAGSITITTQLSFSETFWQHIKFAPQFSADALSRKALKGQSTLHVYLSGSNYQPRLVVRNISIVM